MTKEKLIQCLSTIDSHFGKKQDSRKQKEAAPCVTSTQDSRERENMATIVPALYYITSSFRMEEFL